MDGRTFDESLVKAVTCTDADFLRAQAGEWFAPNPAAAASMSAGMVGMPGLAGLMGGTRSGMPGAPGMLGGLTLPPGFSMGGLPGPQ